MAGSTVAGTNGFRVIGTRPIRHDAVEKVTGRAKYGADYSFPGMLHGKVLRSPHAHARIKSIKYEQALKLPGVFAVITGADFPECRTEVAAVAGEYTVNVRHISHNVIARDKVLYDGHALAAVAASSPHIAEEALRLIEVDYEVLQPVMTLDEAMKPDAVIVFSGRGQAGSPNIADHLQIERGDIDAGFKAADYIVEREFRSSPVHQGYIEPHNALAIYNSDGYLSKHLLLDSGPVHHPDTHSRTARDARGQGPCDPGRDRRRLWG
jgi:xanthine dehydrogenase molybdenum-binding subunit